MDASGHCRFIAVGVAMPIGRRSTSNSQRKRNSPPTVVADAIGKAASARKPKTRYAVGFGAKPLVFHARRALRLPLRRPHAPRLGVPSEVATDKRASAKGVAA